MKKLSLQSILSLIRNVAEKERLMRQIFRTVNSPLTIGCSFLGWNAVGGTQQLAKAPRHPWGPHYGFADGHVKVSRVNQMSWQPFLIPTEKTP